MNNTIIDPLLGGFVSQVIAIDPPKVTVRHNYKTHRLDSHTNQN